MGRMRGLAVQSGNFLFLAVPRPLVDFSALKIKALSQTGYVGTGPVLVAQELGLQHFDVLGREPPAALPLLLRRLHGAGGGHAELGRALL